MLNEMQRDALAEVFNIFIGRAADILSEMTEQKIKLFIPSVELLAARDVNCTYLASCIGICSGHIMSSSIQFGKEYKGKAFLLFPAEKAKLLVSLCLKDINFDNNIIFDERELLDTDFDVMKEVGNIILNSIVGGLGNLLAIKLTYSLPEVELFFISTEKQVVLLKDNIYILMLKTSFFIANTEFNGAILIAFSMNSVTQLISKIDDLWEENDAFTF